MSYSVNMIIYPTWLLFNFTALNVFLRLRKRFSAHITLAFAGQKRHLKDNTNLETKGFENVLLWENNDRQLSNRL